MRLPWDGCWTGRAKALFDATIGRADGGSSSVAERLTVAQDVVGSIPTRRPKIPPRK
jgi:hypothetical protein